MHSPLIRPAELADVPAIHTLICELAEFEKLSHAVVSTEDCLRNALFGEKPSAEALVAVASEAPAGFALFFQNYSTFVGKPGIYLEDIYVKESLRGRGIGAALLSSVARIAAQRDCARLEWSVLDWNREAIGFYEKFGAGVLPDWRIVRMEKSAIEALAGRTTG